MLHLRGLRLDQRLQLIGHDEAVGPTRPGRLVLFPDGYNPAVLNAGYVFSNDIADVDRAVVHRWLSEQAYWALGRTREAQDAAIDASRNYSVHDTGTGRQVAYARVVTDATTFAWLCDVFVSPDVRGSGVGKPLVEGVVADLDALGVRRTLLATADAHGLYAHYGFEPLAEPARWMGRGRV